MEKPHTKFSELSREEKIEHIYEYYKLHILGVILLLLFVGWMLNHYVLNPPPETALEVTFFSTSYNTTGLEEWRDEINEWLIEDGVNETVGIEHFNLDPDGDPQLQMATQAKMGAKIQLGEMDIFVFEGDLYNLYYQEDVLLGLDEFVDSNSLNEKDLYKDSDLGGSGDDLILIDVSENEVFNTRLITDQPIYLAVYNNSDGMELIQKFLDKVLN